jgi:mannose-6-phosphate isomerase-like protein (cupin superfamily)
LRAPITSHSLEHFMRAALVLLAAALSGGIVSTVQAQNPAPAVSNAVQILSASRIAALADSLPPAASTARELTHWDGLFDMISRRDTSGIHERHEGFADIFVVQRGHARLRYGGSADGERLTSPGEWRGGTIRGGTEADLAPGDIVVIPAGIPHQLLLPPHESFYYFVFKVAKPAH